MHRTECEFALTGKGREIKALRATSMIAPLHFFVRFFREALAQFYQVTLKH